MSLPSVCLRTSGKHWTGTDTAEVVNKSAQATIAEAVTPSLSSLSIGALTLTPAFSADERSYTADTTNNRNKVRAASADSGAEIALTLNGKPVENNTSLTWDAGKNTVLVAVKDASGASTEYEVTVNKL